MSDSQGGQGLGASASAETGSQATPEARSDLRPSGFDPARWADFYEKRAIRNAAEALDYIGQSMPFAEFQQHQQKVGYAADCFTIAAALRRLSERAGA